LIFVQRKWASFDTSLGRWQVPLVYVEGDDLDGTGFPLLLTYLFSPPI
jgi:hypothetical protein